jgi:hypothetical protein
MISMLDKFVLTVLIRNAICVPSHLIAELYLDCLTFDRQVHLPDPAVIFRSKSQALRNSLRALHPSTNLACVILEN